MEGSQLRFRVRSIHAGVWLSVSCCLILSGYAGLTWDRPHRGGMVVLLGLCLIGSLGLRCLPLERLVAHRWREAFFIGWSLSIIGVVCVAVALDGGPSSPQVSILFLPLAFASLSYPLRSTLIVGASIMAGYLAVALPHHPTMGQLVVWLAALGNATWMGAWQSLNRERRQAELLRLSRADHLTGCLNRRGLEERLVQALAEHPSVGLVVIDLDEFKQVNDAHGHAAGDAILRWVVCKATPLVRPCDALGRLGGDEFAIVLPGAGPQQTQAAALRLRRALQARAPASVGYATYPNDAADAEALHQAADASLYEMKRARPGLTLSPDRAA